jgi:hypothetical protein
VKVKAKVALPKVVPKARVRSRARVARAKDHPARVARAKAKEELLPEKAKEDLLPEKAKEDRFHPQHLSWCLPRLSWFLPPLLHPLSFPLSIPLVFNMHICTS